jgi:hypothetical protein
MQFVLRARWQLNKRLAKRKKPQRSGVRRPAIVLTWLCLCDCHCRISLAVQSVSLLLCVSFDQIDLVAPAAVAIV